MLHGGETPYLFVAAQLSQQVTSGVLGPGDRLPSSRELETRFGYVNITVRRGIDVLRVKGLIYSVREVGSFVGRQPSGSVSAKVRPAAVHVSVPPRCCPGPHRTAAHRTSACAWCPSDLLAHDPVDRGRVVDRTASGHERPAHSAARPRVFRADQQGFGHPCFKFTQALGVVLGRVHGHRDGAPFKFRDQAGCRCARLRCDGRQPPRNAGTRILRLGRRPGRSQEQQSAQVEEAQGPEASVR
ncbi:GntR family transcriptional regulator [Streptomyces sp. NPDC056304]|uniref:GntR family transcriptional regulator n=1 Tax=Streptomyces sp. NPDC056304 TaxID=3345778 RepID=UPI0035DEFB5B